MTFKQTILGFLAVFAITMPGPLEAEDIVGGTDLLEIQAFQDVTLFGGTSLNGGGEVQLLGLSGTGLAGWTREEQSGNTIALSSYTGWIFSGAVPGFGAYQFGAVGPVTANDLTGSIGDVMQDASDPGFASGDPSSFLSGTLSLSADQFGFEFLSGPLAGVVLETDPAQGFAFEGALTSLPPGVGTTIVNSGDDVLNVLFNGEVVGTSSNRFLVVTAVVPEPSGTIFVLGVVGLLARRRVRRSC